MKVMVVVRLFMRPARAVRLEARSLAGQHHLGDARVALQGVQVAVDRRKIQGRDRSLGQREDLVRRQRPAGVIDRVEHGLALAGVAFHAEILMQMNWQ